ncbi:glycoside hydrolase family 10 protein [Hugenholtzia roseola]|uniref:glycoside hydrolase family 10 protein n=1 Tax=Hugenholtzia roseola TaxID=1002 RepID=UPI0012B617A3|nr:family 10 glycosylhydrolase [Hugenholtzia roseola]
MKIVLFCFCAFLSIVQPLGAQSFQPKREWRAAWIATINNNEFPSAKNLTTAQQQAEFLQILEAHKQNNFNALMVQVRPAADAFYYSLREPWSEYLTGRQGQMPDPFYDPLQFMLEATHEKGLEFHAWFNPFRAVFNKNKSQLAPTHLTLLRPEWFLDYGEQLIFNPALPEVREYVTDIIVEVALRYDIDGVHLDDYFYPYPKKEALLNDSSSYLQYGAGKELAQWRRENINLFIELLHKKIKKHKPYLKIGVSPCAVWRNQEKDPKGSPTKAGITAYDDLYADVRLWLEKGWLDYVAPQIYFSTRHKTVPFFPTLQWWSENAFGRHIYAGHAVYKVGNDKDSTWFEAAEMPRQIALVRSLYETKGEVCAGSAFYNSKVLRQNPAALCDSLRQTLYQFPALPPAMTWLDAFAPPMPTQFSVQGSEKGAILTWQQPDLAQATEKTAYFLLYRFKAEEAIDLNRMDRVLARIEGKSRSFIDTEIRPKESFVYVLTALDRLHNESVPTQALLFKMKKRYLRPQTVIHFGF